MSSRESFATNGSICGSWPAPLLEILELEIDVARRLAGEDREERDRRVAVRAVASEARLRLLAAGLYVLTPRRLSRDNRERRQRKLHGRPLNRRAAAGRPSGDPNARSSRP